MTEWLACIPTRHLELAAGLRRFPRLTAGFTSAEVWLRGPILEGVVPEELRHELLKIPDTSIFLLCGDSLQPEGRRLMYGPVPDLEWVSIQQAFTVVMPPTVLPATLATENPTTVEMRPEPSSIERQSNLMVVDQERWLAYAVSCPEVRLAHLTFSHNPVAGRIMARGTPLPPIPGQLYHETGGVALPCGFQLPEPVDAETVNCLVGAADGDLVLMAADGSCEVVPASCFTIASRSAARLTIGEQYHG